MPSAPSPFRLCLLLSTLLLPLGASAQIAAGQDKFLGNIIGGAVPASFNTYWNQVTPENSGKWGSVEGTRNTMNWTPHDIAYNHAQTSGFKFKAHTLVWGSQYPAWITSLTPTEQRTEIEEWMTLLAARYPNLWAVDVVNEPVRTPLPYKNALGGDGATGWDWVITSFQLARAKFPNAKLFINEYATENDAIARNQMIAIINLLKTRNLIDGIGIQAHAFNLDTLTAAQMTACLDDYAATGLDLYITELDIRGIGSTRTEAAQLSKYQELFPVMWNHPAVKGITLWGYISDRIWLDGAGIMNSDGTERATLTWLKGYVGTGTTTPAAPSNLAASTASSSSIGLTWTDNASNETAFKVERATAASGPWSEIAGSLAPGTTSYSATGLMASTTYYFRVRAGNIAGDSAYSATATATTAAVSSGGGGSSSSGRGGGGGAPSLWFLACLSLAALGRLRSRRS